MVGSETRLQIPNRIRGCFNLSEKETRVATAHRDAHAPTIEQIQRVLESMSTQSDIERRNRALIAFTLLTGARDGATASFKLKHIDLVGEKIEQDAREVKTKRSKTFTTFFFPVDDDFRNIVVDWVNFLRKEKLWGNDDPLFPSTEVIPGPAQRFEVIGLARRHGAIPRRSELFSRKPLLKPACPTSIRTASERRSSCSDSGSAKRPSS
jgi:integrase